MQIIVYNNQGLEQGVFNICIGSNQWYQIRLKVTTNFGNTTQHFFDTSDIALPIDPVLVNMLDTHIGKGIWKYTPCNVNSIGLCENYAHLEKQVSDYVNKNMIQIQEQAERLSRIK